MDMDEFADSSDNQQKSTHITYENPDHPDMSPSYTDQETARSHFQAVKAIQNSRIDRRLIVGEFLRAIEAQELRDDEDAIEEFFERLQE